VHSAAVPPRSSSHHQWWCTLNPERTLNHGFSWIALWQPLWHFERLFAPPPTCRRGDVAGGRAAEPGHSRVKGSRESPEGCEAILELAQAPSFVMAAPWLPSERSSGCQPAMVPTRFTGRTLLTFVFTSLALNAVATMAAASPLKQMRKGVKSIPSYGRLGGRPWRSGGLAAAPSALGARARLWAQAADRGLYGVPGSRQENLPTHPPVADLACAGGVGRRRGDGGQTP
jgi:hypothetical protein